MAVSPTSYMMSTNTLIMTTRKSGSRSQSLRWYIIHVPHHSGTNAECTTNNIDDAWTPLSQWLRCNGRQAFNTETGGGNTASCQTMLCQQVQAQAQNSDGMWSYFSTICISSWHFPHSHYRICWLGCWKLLPHIRTRRDANPEW